MLFHFTFWIFGSDLREAELFLATLAGRLDIREPETGCPWHSMAKTFFEL